MTDLRYALRALAKAPTFTLGVILTLAIGIGASAAVFTAIRSTLLAQLPFARPEQLFELRPDGERSASKKVLLDFREAQGGAFSGVAGYSRWGFTMTGSGAARKVTGARVTENFFDVLGAKPLHGQTFAAGQDGTVVVSHDFWRTALGGNPAVIGQTIRIDDRERVVAGVMPTDFRFPSRRSEVWLPIVVRASDEDFTDGYLTLFARAQGTLDAKQAAAQVRAASMRMAAGDRGAYGTKFGQDADARPLREALFGQIRPMLVLLMAAVLLVLLIACLNVASLVVTRAAEREREIAVRTALGAGGGAILRHFAIESLLLALGGGAASVLFAWAGARLLAAGTPNDLPGAIDAAPSPSTLFFTFVLSVAIGLVFGLAASLRFARRDAGVLRENARGASEGRPRRRLRDVLVVGEIALALVLLGGAGLLLKSFWRLSSVDPGFAAEQVQAVTISLPDAYEGDGVVAAERLLRERLAAVPGVAASGVVHILPLGGNNWNPSLTVEGRNVPEDQRSEVDWRVASPSYFAAMRIPLLRGRGFTDADRKGGERVALINRTLAAKQFANEDPIGKRVRTAFEGEEWATIVGVVGDTRDQSLAGPARPQIYRPLAQWPTGSFIIMVRGSATARELALAVESVDRNIPVQVEAMEDVVAASIAQPRSLLTMLMIFAAIAMTLAAVGIYSVTFHGVVRRTREIGIRLAVGSRPRDILANVLGRMAVLASIGVALGFAGAAFGSRLLEKHLFEVSRWDVATFGAVGGLVSLIALIAAWIPAWRASRIDPVTALRYE